MLDQGRLKLNWKLLIWPSVAIRFGLEQNTVYIHSTRSVSLCTANFSSLFPSSSHLSLDPIHRYWLSSGGKHSWRYYSHHPWCTDYSLCTWMNSVVRAWYLWIRALRSALAFSGSTQMWKQWLYSLLETALLYKEEKRNHSPWQVRLDVSFLGHLCGRLNVGKVQFSKNK